MTERMVKVTLTFTYPIDDTIDNFESYYGTADINEIDIETVREVDGNDNALMLDMLNDAEDDEYKLDWADD